MEQALSARFAVATGLAATGPDGGIQVDRRRPGGVVFNERTVAITALADQLAKAMESKDKTAIGTAAAAIGNTASKCTQYAFSTAHDDDQPVNLYPFSSGTICHVHSHRRHRNSPRSSYPR